MPIRFENVARAGIKQATCGEVVGGEFDGKHVVMLECEVIAPNGERHRVTLAFEAIELLAASATVTPFLLSGALADPESL